MGEKCRWTQDRKDGGHGDPDGHQCVAGGEVPEADLSSVPSHMLRFHRQQTSQVVYLQAGDLYHTPRRPQALGASPTRPGAFSMYQWPRPARTPRLAARTMRHVKLGRSASSSSSESLWQERASSVSKCLQGPSFVVQPTDCAPLVGLGFPRSDVSTLTRALAESARSARTCAGSVAGTR
jgi:hypothetical protein